MESQKAIEILQQTDPSYLKSIVAISFLSVFIAPVAEELLFRGVLYVYLRDIGFHKTAVFICSFIFAMIHCNIAVFLPLFCFSIFLVWLYEKYGNLSVCIVTHSVFNLANVLLCLFLGGEV